MAGSKILAVEPNLFDRLSDRRVHNSIKKAQDLLYNRLNAEYLRLRLPAAREEGLKGNQAGRPAVISILIGVGIFAGLLCVSFYMGEAVKVIGAPFLFLPTQLGLVDRINPAAVVRWDLNSHETILKFNEAGPYVLYVADLDLLEISNGIEKNNAEPWLMVVNRQDRQKVQVNPIRRGLAPFDSVLARGRPVYSFSIPAPGIYELRHPARHEPVSLLPDTVTGRETVLWLAYLVQIAILAALVALLTLRSQRKQRRRLREIQSLKHIDGENFWKRELEKQEGGKQE